MPGRSANDERTDWLKDSSLGSQLSKEEFSLHVVTANGTTWESLRVFLQQTSAHVVLGQEIHIMGSKVDEASQWAAKRGWKSVWSPALKGKGEHGTSGGVVILAKSFLGLMEPPGQEAQVVPSRVVSAVVEAPATRPIQVYSAYLTNGEGLSEANVDILRRTGKHATTSGRAFIIGGDFNVSPELMAGSGFAEEMKATLVAAESAAGTCRTSEGFSHLDFSFVEEGLARGLASVGVDSMSTLRPHSPVDMIFHPKLTSLKALGFRRPPAIPLDPITGPRPRPESWEGISERAVWVADEAFRQGKGWAARQFSSLYQQWADTAERELVAVTGVELPVTGTRGRGPKLVWRPIMPAEGVRTSAREDAALWLHIRQQEVLKARGQFGFGSKADKVRQQVVSIKRVLSKHSPIVLRSHQQLLDLSARLGRACDSLLSFLGRWGACGPDCIEEEAFLEEAQGLDDELGSLSVDLEEARSQEASEVFKARASAWSAWANTSIDQGARNAHRFSRAPVSWRPTTTLMQGGVVTSDPAQLLQGQAELYGGVWRAEEEENELDWQPMSCLPPVSCEKLRAISSSFSPHSAISVDGFHMKHYRLLSDDGVMALSRLFSLMETLGALPGQVKTVMVLLLGKPKGGFRPIGLFASFYRLWARARRPFAEEWEAKNWRGYFACGAGRGAQDAVWRQAVRSEAGVARQEVACSLLWDMRKFYELFDFARLAARAWDTGFPMQIVRVSLAAYAGPRHLSLSGMVTKALYASNGIVAGCGFATTYVKVYCLRPFDTFVHRCPTVSLDAYIDDLTISSIGEASIVREAIVSGGLELHRVIQDELVCEIAMDKPALVSSCRSTMKEIRRVFGDLAGASITSTVNLGTDYTAGASRVLQGSGSKRKSRLRAALARRCRVRRLKGVLGHKASRLFTTGLGPAAMYGSNVNGVTDQEILQLRRTAAAGLRPQAQGRSLSMLMLLEEDPAWRAGVAPILQWAREAWNATTTWYQEGVFPCRAWSTFGGRHGLLLSATRARRDHGRHPEGPSRP